MGIRPDEITFLDGLDYCEVHGHDSVVVDTYVIDICGNVEMKEKCRKCNKTRETLVKDKNLRLNSYTYPRGVWH